MSQNGDGPIHGGTEDTFSDTEAALRRRIAKLEARLGSEIKSGFHDHTTQQLWTEEQCRTMLNAALMYLASIEPDAVLRLPVEKILKMAEQTDGLAMSLSDDDKVLSIIAQAKQ